MKWPEFSGEIGIAASDDLYRLVVQEKLYKPLQGTSVRIDLLQFNKKEFLPDGGFIFIPAWLNFFIAENFIKTHFSQNSTSFLDFYRELEAVFDIFSGIYNSEQKETVRSAMFSFYYSGEDNKIFLFQLHNNTTETLLKRTNDIFHTISRITNGELKSEIERAHKMKDRVYYFNYYDNKWQVIDPITEIAEVINSDYKQNTDNRVNKPDIILQEDNLNRKYTFGDNWVLQFDGLSTLMTRPNDVSIYASICERNLIAAKKFYESTILPRHEHYHGPFPSIEQQREYYDYFELITTAMIFAFTAVEALVNIAIPNDYIHNNPTGKYKGKVNDKAYIERYYTFEHKLNTVLKEILLTPDPAQEEWWSDLIELKNLRDQSIHTKQSFSEQRYSKLLGKDIFRLIDVHKVIISFYGRYIKLNKPELLNIFPYGFDHDEAIPSLMTDETYRKIYNDLHNPSHPL